MPSLQTNSVPHQPENQRKLYQQFLPDHTAAEYARMKKSIAERGVETPVIEDQKGNLIDGELQEQICLELGIPCPKEVRQFESEAEKYELALTLHCQRRQFNRKQKRELIGAYLRVDPEIADNHLAEIIGGVSKNTVAKVRRHLERTRQIDKFTKLRGKDGKSRPVKYKKIITNTPKELETARRVISDLPENCAGKTLDVISAKRRAARKKNCEERQGRILTPLATDSIRLYHCPFQQLEEIAGIKPNSGNLFLTDIPYGQEFLPQVHALGELAARLLVDGGLFVCMCGQYWLRKVMDSLDQALTYRWEAACVWEGGGTPVHVGGWKHPHGRIISKWKPLLIYSKGAYTRKGQWTDVYPIDGKEKDWHEWQQSLALFEMLLRDFSDAGDMVLDPCGGGFTTAEACFRRDRQCISCDIEKDCVIGGQQRLEQAQQQRRQAQ